jgi:hypothetical protein
MVLTLDNIASSFLFLKKKNFIETNGSYSSKDFGNALIIMRGDSFSLRFERDRGQIMIDIGGNQIGWFKLEYALEFIDRSINQEDFGEPPSVPRLADLLQKHWLSMEELLGNKNKIDELKEFTSLKTETLIKKIFRNSTS